MALWNARWPRIVVVACGLLAAPGLSYRALNAQEVDRSVLRFSEPMAAIINARAWDQTQHEWHTGPEGELFYDAVHRFLLLRFPGCARAVHERLSEGWEVESATLVLHWERQEFLRVAGYAWRGSDLEDKEPPTWRAQAWLLRRPWTDDPAIGPTWNAWINGAGYWRLGGARGQADRFPGLLAQAPLNEQDSLAQLDVTAVFSSPLYGDEASERLRTLEDCGFLVKRAELSDIKYGDRGLSTGVARTWVREPELVVKMRRAERSAELPPLPEGVDVSELARRLRAAGGEGEPSTRIPDNLEELARAWREKRRGDMPAWMWKRVQQVWDVPPYWGIEHGYDWFTFVMKALDGGERGRYEEMIQKILAMPPGWFAGHQHIEFIIPLLECPELLPEVVRYHLRKSFEARWELPLAPDKVFAHGKVLGWGTLNHMANVRPKALLGAQATGLTWLTEKAQAGMSLLNRTMIYSDGYSQEMGDSYYRGITLGPLRAAAKYAADDLMRLMADLMVEKLLFEDISTYHPGLRKRVSRISRRMGGLDQLILEQDVPEAVLHTLSRQGVLIETDVPGEKPTVSGIRVFNMHATPPARVALMAPWRPGWETNTVDGKPLPFRTVFSTRVMGRVTEPIHAMTYMGRNYALASEEAYSGATVPMFAAWRRRARTVERIGDFGVMLLRGRLNEQPPSVLDKSPFGILQHDNKLVWAVRPIERKFVDEAHPNLPESVKDGLTSFKAQVCIIGHGPERQRQVYLNGTPVNSFPARARQGDLITVKEGVSFLGLIPLPATDLGRTDEVVIRSAHPFLLVDSYVFQSDSPLPNDEATWKALSDATAGWVVELGDEAEHGSFDAFQHHMQQARLKARWKPAEHVLHVAYASGGDSLEVGFRTTFERETLWHQQLNPSLVFAYRRVNGRWPWPQDGIALDNPLGQMGKAAVLEKGGAALKTLEGQMAFLRVEPLSGIYEGINPFVEPTPFELATPEGVVVRSEGALGMARVTVRPEDATLWVDYALPPPEGSPGLELLQAEQPELFRAGVNVKEVRARSARALLVQGMAQNPTVILNGEPLEEPIARFSDGQKTWYRVPIAPENWLTKERR